MKKFFLMILVAGMVFSSCSDKGKKVEATDAKEVKTVKNESTATYAKIKDGSNMDWRASHLGGLEPRFGKINLKSAKVLVNDNAITNASVVIDMSSFSVDNFEDEESKNKLTGHLQSDDFFKVEKYPTSKFELTSIVKATGDYNSLITGNLTILDATKSITFNANVVISDKEVSVKSEDFAVNRTDWGLVYNTEGTEGVPTNYIISNDVGFTINITLLSEK